MNNLEKLEQVKKNTGKKENNDIFQILNIDTNFLKLVPGFDGHSVRIGEYSAKYFIRTKEIVADIADKNQIVTMQVFQKTAGATVCGVDIVENLIKFAAGEYQDEKEAREMFENYQELKQMEKERFENTLDNEANMYEAVKAYGAMIQAKKDLDAVWKPAMDKVEIEIVKQDGDIVDQFQPVIKIKGPYKYFAKLESVYLGILARATKVMTNTRKVVREANGKPVLFFADRFDIFATQALDGYAALQGGVQGVATDAQGRFQNMPGIGTMPHALIATFGGDTGQATLAFANKYPDVPVISLVDFENNCAKTAVEVGQYLKDNGKKLYGVRLDTSGSMADEGVLMEKGVLEEYFSAEECVEIRVEYQENKETKNVVNNSIFCAETRKKLKEKGLTGVCPRLVELVRAKLDETELEDVMIYVSGGFNAEKIRDFEEKNVPVDGYGVGSSLLAPKYVKDNGDFTADIVRLNGESVCKVGRKEF